MLNYPYLGSHAAIIFLESNICWVSSGTVSALLVTIQFTAAPKATSSVKIQHTPSLMGFVHLYCWLPRAVRGAKPGMKKCNLGKIVARISSWTTYYYKPQEFSTEQKMLATRILSLINTVSRKDSKIIQGHCTLGREPCWQPISWDLHSAVQGTLKAKLKNNFLKWWS